MTVKNVIILACNLSSKKVLADKLKNGTALSTAEQVEVDEMTEGFNLIQNEVCTEIIPTIFSEKIIATHGQFDISALTKTFAYVHKFTSLSGEAKKFKIRNGKIEFSGEAMIEYCFCPENLTINQEIKSMCLPDRVLAYGVLREYFLKQELGSDATLYEEKFKNSIKNFCSVKSEVKIPKRAWM